MKNSIILFCILLMFQCKLDIQKKNMIKCNHDANRQILINKTFDDIRYKTHDYINIKNDTINLISQNHYDGKTPLHVVIEYKNEKVLYILIENMIHKLSSKKHKYINKGSLSNWINIEDNLGKTAADYLSDNSFRHRFTNDALSDDIFNNLLNSGMQKGTNISYNQKVQSKKLYYSKLMNELRICLFNNNYEKGRLLINYFNCISKKIISIIVYIWIKEAKPVTILSNNFPSYLYNYISSYICIYNIKTELNNFLLDEAIFFGNNKGELFKLLQASGARHSDTYIENNLFYTKTQNICTANI